MSSRKQRSSKVRNREEAAFVCSHIFDQRRPVLYVCRQGGDWQFLCGAEHAPTELPRVVGAAHIFERDPSLKEVADLRVDWEAERRAIGEPWLRRACSD